VVHCRDYECTETWRRRAQARWNGGVRRSRAEWNQIYHEVWRIQRDFLYDPHWHGLDLAAAEKKYAPYLKGAGGREDVNHLFIEMLGEITIGHMFVAAGTCRKLPR